MVKEDEPLSVVKGSMFHSCRNNMKEDFSIFPTPQGMVLVDMAISLGGSANVAAPHKISKKNYTHTH